jgi:hypothetical protein
VISKPEKKDVSKYGNNNLKKIIQQSPITILPMIVAGKFPQNIEAVFCWVRGRFLWVWIMGSQNVMGSGYGSNICETAGTLSSNFCGWWKAWPVQPFSYVMKILGDSSFIFR